ncbi:hypothetical protein BS47DRAFT_1338452 [Hydnum rufescens UP504]|uniref:Uncharacterized protein n=1 Tax=Hydnum rufescens UP504 TaxID=1448309 RepID=A0A9P6DX77_9AGAM|nr:hypothetical protein BS47DRAFT_1338452 [Hydnum rufescens UP504]
MELWEGIQNASAVGLSQLREDTKTWENELRGLQAVLPKDAAPDKLENRELPALGQQNQNQISKL